ncbi:MAG: hypothetical protein CV087_10495, partial [Candidatus Brocadia sp. WS118]
MPFGTSLSVHFIQAGIPGKLEQVLACRTCKNEFNWDFQSSVYYIWPCLSIRGSACFISVLRNTYYAE